MPNVHRSEHEINTSKKCPRTDKFAHTKILNDVLNVELCTDNLKLSSHSWVTPGNAEDESIPQRLHERQLKKSSLMQNTLSLKQDAACCGEGAEELPKM